MVAAAVALWISSGAGTAAADLEAHAIYSGGDIITVNDSQPTAEAIAVKDGRILAVGARADVLN
jgi:predicted amidohydrolase YtcJ